MASNGGNINMSENLIEIHDLEVIYQSGSEIVQAVNRINFSIKKGKTLGIVGETGAGKSTTALSIMRLLPERSAKILSGRIDFNGIDLMSLTENEMLLVRGEKISMIFQDPMTALNPVLTIGDQIAEALLLHNHDNKSHEQIIERVKETLEMVGIPTTRINHYPHQFSGGMKQRVVIAIALACEPALLIADEPTTALDVTIQAQVLAMISELQLRLNTSMLMITHDFGIVAQTCDDVCVMYAGEIIEYGSAEDIFCSENHHPYTEGLFGSIPNLKVDTYRLTTIEGSMPDPTDLPIGCKFSPRCSKCMDICKVEMPTVFVEGTHKIQCHLYTTSGTFKG